MLPMNTLNTNKHTEHSTFNPSTLCSSTLVCVNYIQGAFMRYINYFNQFFLY